MKPFLIGLYGPTASGKSDLAESLADETGARLISSDAFQVYRGLDIGTGKSARRDEYALIDVVPPTFQMGLGEWLRIARSELSNCFTTGRSVVVVGGTGLYLRALLEGYDDFSPPPDPALRARLNETSLPDLVEEFKRRAPGVEIDFQNPVRVRRALERLECPPAQKIELPDFRIAKFGIEIPTPEIRSRISERVDKMIEVGWAAEVANLKVFVPKSAPALAAIGYRLLWDAADPVEVVDEIKTLTMRYAKRQRTWMRAEKNLATISPVDGRRTVTDWIRGKMNG